MYKRYEWADKIAALARRPDEVYERVYNGLLKTCDFRYIRGKTTGTFEMVVCTEVLINPWEMDLVRDPKELFLYLTTRFAECPVGKTYPKVSPDDMSKCCTEEKIFVTVYFHVSGPPPPNIERLMGQSIGGF